jgi:hypothetical protein
VGTTARREEARSDEELEQELIALSGHMAAATARYVDLVAELDETEAYGRWECRSAAHFLNWKCGVNLRTAHDYVRVARALRHLPLVRAALAGGEVSYSKVRAIIGVANAENEEALLVWARHATAAILERIVAKFARVELDAAKETHDSRFVALGHDDDGAGVGRLRLDPEELALLQRAVEAFRTELRSGSREPGDKSPNNADALMAIPAHPHADLALAWAWLTEERTIAEVALRERA